MKSVLLIGCGWLGSQIVEFLEKRGYRVGVSTRALNKSSLFKPSTRFYQSIVEGDQYHIVFNGTTMQEKFDYCIICLPPYENTEQHLKNIVDQLGESTKFILTSSIGIYQSNAFINEASKINQQHILARIEQALPQERSIILRLGGLLGPNRHPIYSLCRNKRSIAGEETINLIDSRDIVEIVERLMDQDKFRGLYNVVYPLHPKKSDYYALAAKNLLGKEVSSLKEGLAKKIDGQRIVDEIKRPYVFAVDNWNSFSVDNI